jgi:hypothetical protein
MTHAMSSLVDDHLVEWLIEQKRISCAPRALIKQHYDQLDKIDMQ